MITAPYGSWPSPISAADVAGGSLRLDGARFVGEDVWWSEGIPAERGRTALLRAPIAQSPSAEPEILLPAPWSVRSRVHEYGGGAWTADPDGVAYFVEQSDQRVYRFVPGEEPRPLTPAGGGAHGDLTLADGALWAVRETEVDGGSPARDIVRIPLDGSGADDPGAIVSVVAGSDFLASPAPRGNRIAWIAWNHPDMPWDAAELRVGALGPDGRVTDHAVVAGGRGAAGGAHVSALQPEWTGDDALVFAADIPGPSGAARWNLHAVRFDGRTAIAPVPILPADADTGGPLWNLGARWFAPLGDGRILAVQTNGSDGLVVIDPESGREDSLVTPLSGDVLVRDARGARVLLTGAGATVPGGLWLLDVDARTIAPIRGGIPSGDLDPRWMSVARAVTFPGPNGPVHAFDYPPTNPEARAPEGELPPYLVLVHGGPTGHVAGTQSLVVSYFTSRGIGVLDVNYGGSSGYGRAYRDRLRGAWGVVDVQDTAAAVTGMVRAGRADPERIAIKGGSAGGWTVLCSVADTDVFAAGISRYGVADLRRLVADTHDFEARYLDGLVGPLPEAEDVYIARSPLSRPETLRTPLLILQGADDPVVPPSQSEALRDALAANGVPHAYLLFAGESHGFRRADTLQRAFEAELAFLGEVLGFATPGVPPLPLDGSAPRQSV